MTAGAPRAGAGLIALAAGGFGIGLTEFVIAGILDTVASALHVSVPSAGWLVSGYALAVVIGAICLTPLLVRVEPKRALLVLMAFFVVGNAISAAAPGFGILLVGRVVAAFAHGAFFGIGAVLAASLVERDRQARAIAVMFGGLTLANVLGVPLGSFVGQQWGWRATFVVITAVGVLAYAGIALLVPAVSREGGAPRLRSEAAAFTRPQVWISLGLTVLIFGGMFGAFAFVEPLLTRVSGFSTSTVPLLLVLFGLGLTAGNVLGGRWADRGVDRTLTVVAATLLIVLVAFALTAGNRVAAAVSLTAMGLLGFSSVPALQTRVMRYAPGAPTLASAANIAAFNGGNFLGVYLSGTAIGAGLGYRSPLWVACGFTALGLALVVVASAVGRNAGRSVASSSNAPIRVADNDRASAV